MTTPDPDPHAPPRAASSPTPSPDPAPRRRRPRSAALLVVAAGLVVLATLTVLWALGSSQAPDGSATAGNPAPSANPAPAPAPHRHRSTEFQQFLADCAHSFEGWRPGQVTYPHDVDVPLDGSRNYRARIDISPGAQDRPAPDADTAAVPLEVRCGIGALRSPWSTAATPCRPRTPTPAPLAGVHVGRCRAWWGDPRAPHLGEEGPDCGACPQDPAQRKPGGTSSASPVGGARRRPARQEGRRH
jgi:hypothetical protein